MVLIDTNDGRRLVSNTKWSHEQEIIRAKAIVAELKLNTEKAHKLIHTARNLITVHRLMLEEIHWHKHRRLTNH